MRDAVAQSAILEALTLLMEPGGVVELRALDVSTPTYRRPHTVSGYFDDRAKLAEAAASLRGAKGIYITLNPVNPALLARAANRLRIMGPKDASTSDADIVRRHWLPIDGDPVKPAGIAATAAEHEAALCRARLIRETLGAEGWPEPITANGGNSGHVLYGIDLPNDEASRTLLEGCLWALAFRFSDDRVSIDRTVFNAARIWRCYGTLNRKGDDIPERPHRKARLLEVPDTIIPVSPELLEALARSVPQATERSQAARPGDRQPFDLGQWIAGHGLAVIGPQPWDKGQKWIFPVCPWNADHRNRAAYIVQHASGAIAAGCHHNGCAGNDWYALRDLVEPGWRERRTNDAQRNGRPPSGTVSPAVPAMEQSRTAGAAAESPWEPPVPFYEVALPPFPNQALPDWQRAFVKAEAEATQTPPDLAGMLTLSVMAATCAKKVRIQIKEGYTEPVNIYTATALAPGNRKTQVFADVVAPLEAWESAQAEVLRDEIAEAQARYRIMEQAVQKAQSDAAKASPTEREALTTEAIQLARELAAMHVPMPPRLIADDVSPERLATLLRDHDGRMAVMAAEGDVFDLMAGRYGNGSRNFGVYLRGHAGDTLRVDRVGRPPEFVQQPALSLGLAIQPEVLRGLIDKPGFRGRGLLGRFLYAIPPSLLGRRKPDAPPVPAKIRNTYQAHLRKLLQFLPDTDEEGRPQPHMLRLSQVAAARLHAFAQAVEPQLSEFGGLGHMTDWAGKLVGATARLAALLHMGDHVTADKPWAIPIPAGTVDRAIRIARYLIPHARAAYAEMGGDPVVEAARYVLAWIRQQPATHVTKRTLFEGTKGRFKRVSALEPALALLIEHGFLRERPPEERTGPGRKPSPLYDVNPLIGSHNSRDSHNGAGSSDSANSTNPANQSAATEAVDIHEEVF
jgi:Protein of unknown function (DUF3987)